MEFHGALTKFDKNMHFRLLEEIVIYSIRATLGLKKKMAK